MVGPPTTPPGPLTLGQRMQEEGSVAYEGLKTAIRGICDCSDIFLPLKTVAEVLLTICMAVDVRGSICYNVLPVDELLMSFAYQRVSANKTELEQLTVKLWSIRSIVEKYQEHNGLRALDHRVEFFCQSVNSSSCLYIIDIN